MESESDTPAPSADTADGIAAREEPSYAYEEPEPEKAPVPVSTLPTRRGPLSVEERLQQLLDTGRKRVAKIVKREEALEGELAALRTQRATAEAELAHIESACGNASNVSARTRRHQ